ncbi:TetR/AcrR family transcriptional regulator [Nocardia tengchongensis]|uniref:TetR/AcrR family transcriptional regulator n=1 Tax=Nocardia tengchongensis TaxID=2055889 RepID=UPI0036887FC2
MTVEKKSTGVWHISPERPARPQPKRRNGPRLPLPERREQLLDAARVVVGRDGLPGITMQAVAKQAGVAKPVLYAVYPTAPELIDALLEREHARGMEQLRDTIPADLNDADPDAEYFGAVMAFLAAVRDEPIRWRLILMPAEGAPADYRGLLSEARGRLVARCIQLLELGIEMRGGPSGADVELVGHVMLGFIEVLGRLVLSDPEKFPPERLETTVRAMMRTLPKDRAAVAGDSVVEAWRQGQ